jgi:hypothetical protein
MVFGNVSLIALSTVERKSVLLRAVEVTQSKAAMSDTDFYRLHRKYCNTNVANTDNCKPEECGYRNGATINNSPKSPKRITGKDIKLWIDALLSSKYDYRQNGSTRVNKKNWAEKLAQYTLAVTWIRDRRGFY